MFNKLFTLSFIVVAFLISSMAFGQTIVFQDDFESYVAGQQLACQNPTDWTTWSEAPCDPTEDAYVSNAYALSGNNSVNIIQNNDLVKPLDNKTNGIWRMSFYMYIPSGNEAYFNTLSSFTGGVYEWAMEVYFYTGAAGSLNAGGTGITTFTFPYDTWFDVELVVDLDNDQATLTIDAVTVYTWQWTLGANGGGSALQLAANDFYGHAATADWYFDDYQFDDMSASSTIIFFDDFESYTAGEQLACQNPTDWTTWSEAPCDPTEDAYVSNAYAYNGVNSVNIVQNNDLIKPLGDLTSGKWGISFFMYIPTGAEAYFNTLSSFTGGVYEWAMEAYFYTGAAGSLNAGGTGTATFTFPYDTWFPVLVVVDLNNDMAEFWVDGVQVYSWQWTLGATGGGTSLQLAANDFYGHAATADWYFDDYQFEDLYIVPVELTSFTANVNTSGQVVLNWTTATELNNQMFEIQRSADNNQFITIGYVDGQGTTTEPQEYSYVDKTVETGKYFYRLKQIDFGGQYEYSDVTEVDVNGPLTYSLEQNYPNPFNPSTVIKYSVANAGHVRLVVYNLVGEEVSVLVNGMVDAGFYQVSFDASNLPSGIYLYKLEAPGFVQIKKMMLMK